MTAHILYLMPILPPVPYIYPYTPFILLNNVHFVNSTFVLLLTIMDYGKYGKKYTNELISFIFDG